jgi:hypothetical protein
MAQSDYFRSETVHSGKQTGISGRGWDARAEKVFANDAVFRKVFIHVRGGQPVITIQAHVVSAHTFHTEKQYVRFLFHVTLPPCIV